MGSVTQEQIIAAVRTYARSICRHMQRADREDVEQETLAYMLANTWKPEAYRQTIWRRLICLSMRANERMVSALELNCDLPVEPPPPETHLVATELFDQCCRDVIDTRLLLMLAAGHTWRETAARLRISPRTLARRLREMRLRLAANPLPDRLHGGRFFQRAAQCGSDKPAQKLIGSVQNSSLSCHAAKKSTAKETSSK